MPPLLKANFARQFETREEISCQFMSSFKVKDPKVESKRIIQ